MSTHRPAQAAAPGRLLVVAPHPTDADLAIGGIVARWVARGTVAHLACLSSGEAGGPDAAADPMALAVRREDEQRRAAAIIGYDAVTFMHRPHGAVANDLALREQLVRLLRTVRPDAVATIDPRPIVSDAGEVRSVDQRATGAATIDAIHPAAGQAMTFPHLVRSEGLEPHRVSRLHLFEAERPGTWVDISDAVEVKVEAVRAHASQSYRFADVEAFIRERAARDGATFGVDAAETLTTVELRGSPGER